jgi:hypothetical protein
MWWQLYKLGMSVRSTVVFRRFVCPPLARRLYGIFDAAENPLKCEIIVYLFIFKREHQRDDYSINSCMIDSIITLPGGGGAEKKALK